jgi:HEAT repeat protein
LARALNTGNAGACKQELTALAKLHNKALFEVLQKLENNLNGFKYSIADAYTSISERINNPLKYGMSWSLSWYRIDVVNYCSNLICLLFQS